MFGLGFSSVACVNSNLSDCHRVVWAPKIVLQLKWPSLRANAHPYEVWIETLSGRSRLLLRTCSMLKWMRRRSCVSIQICWIIVRSVDFWDCGFHSIVEDRYTRLAFRRSLCRICDKQVLKSRKFPTDPSFTPIKVISASNCNFHSSLFSIWSLVVWYNCKVAENEDVRYFLKVNSPTSIMTATVRSCSTLAFPWNTTLYKLRTCWKWTNSTPPYEVQLVTSYHFHFVLCLWRLERSHVKFWTCSGNNEKVKAVPIRLVLQVVNVGRFYQDDTELRANVILQSGSLHPSHALKLKNCPVVQDMFVQRYYVTNSEPTLCCWRGEINSIGSVLRDCTSSYNSTFRRVNTHSMQCFVCHCLERSQWTAKKVTECCVELRSKLNKLLLSAHSLLFDAVRR